MKKDIQVEERTLWGDEEVAPELRGETCHRVDTGSDVRDAECVADHNAACLIEPRGRDIAVGGQDRQDRSE